MATIKKRNGSYQITVTNGTDINGKKIRETCTIKYDESLTELQNTKAVEKYAREFEDRVKNGKYLKGEKLTLKEYADKWKKEYAEQVLEETTRDAYYHHIDRVILPALGHIKLADIRPLHLQSLYNNLTEDGIRIDGKPGGYSYGTIKRYHAVISSMLSTAVQWQLIESNPCDRVKIPKTTKKKAVSTNVKCFTLEQAEIFIKALDMEYTTEYKSHKRVDDTGKEYNVKMYVEKRSIPMQFRVFFNIAIFGGLRKGELLALTWKDIDFDNCSISITKSAAYTGKKVINKDTKNSASERTIKLPLSAFELLRIYKREQNEYRLSIGDLWQGDNYLFIQTNGKQMHPSTPYHTFKDILEKYNKTVKEKAEKLPDITLHDLRHTSATLLIANNVDVRTVSARLGHAQTSTTMNIYAHALSKMDEKAAETLENIFSNKA